MHQSPDLNWAQHKVAALVRRLTLLLERGLVLPDAPDAKRPPVRRRG
jgi:hypothetical protein